MTQIVVLKANLVLLVFSFFMQSFVLASPKTDAVKLAQEVLNTYQTSPAVEMKLQKESRLALLEETKKSEGYLFLSKGRLRLKIDTPEPSLVVMLKKVIWIETPASAELGGKPQVLKIVSKTMSKQARAPIAAFLGQKNAWSQFRITSKTITRASVALQMEPVKKNGFGDIQKLFLEIDQEDRLIKKISYEDHLENKTSFVFLRTTFRENIEKNLFSYRPPKNAEITVYR